MLGSLLALLFFQILNLLTFRLLCSATLFWAEGWVQILPSGIALIWVYLVASSFWILDPNNLVVLDRCMPINGNITTTTTRIPLARRRLTHCSVRLWIKRFLGLCPQRSNSRAVKEWIPRPRSSYLPLLLSRTTLRPGCPQIPINGNFLKSLRLSTFSPCCDEGF